MQRRSGYAVGGVVSSGGIAHGCRAVRRYAPRFPLNHHQVQHKLAKKHLKIAESKNLIFIKALQMWFSSKFQCFPV
jgi:hypothetical protein